MSATATKPKKKVDEPVTFGGTIDIPARCKPSRALSPDGTRPVLQQAYLRKREDGLWLCVTDSYIAVTVKVRGDAQEGWIPGGALKHMERGASCKQLDATSWEVKTEQYATTVYDVNEMVTRSKPFPDFDAIGVWNDRERTFGPSDELAVGINPDLMKRISDAFGCDRYTGCRFEFFGPLHPIVVTPMRTGVEARALQMPIRLNV